MNTTLKIKNKNKTYVLNPTLKIKTEVQYRMRNQEPHHFEFFHNSPQEKLMIKIFQQVQLFRDKPREFTTKLKKHLPFLIDAGILVSENKLPTEIASDCFLDENNLQYVCKKERRKFQQMTKSELRFNEGFIFIQDGKARPVTTHSGMPLVSQFPFLQKILWVFDPGSGVWSFFAIDSRQTKMLALLQQKKLKWQDLPQNTIEMLYQTRVLVTKNYNTLRQKHWKKLYQQAPKAQSNGWVTVRKVLSPFVAATLHAYSKKILKNGYYNLDNEQVKSNRRHYCPRNVLSDYYNRQVGQLVRQATSESCFPSWSLFSTYLPKARLDRHVDRPTCAWNVSIAIGTTAKIQRPWPFFVQKKAEKPVRIILENGDAAIYRGHKLPHWRNELMKNRLDTVMILFYVPVDFMGMIYELIT